MVHSRASVCVEELHHMLYHFLQCYATSFGFYQSWIVTMAIPVILLGLCTAINFWATWLEKGLGHPRNGGWLLPTVSDKRREWWLQWAGKLRSRCAHQNDRTGYVRIGSGAVAHLLDSEHRWPRMRARTQSCASIMKCVTG